MQSYYHPRVAMSKAENVISLAQVRREKQRVKIDALPHDRLSEKIDCIAHRYVSPGAVLLLRQIARFLHGGDGELSFSFLCDELRVTRQTLARYTVELEDTGFLRVRRSRVGKANATNQFEIDFNGPLGAPMPHLPTPKKPRIRGSSKIIPVVRKVDGNTSTIHKDNTTPKGVERSAPRSFSTVAEARTFVEARVTRTRTAKVEKQAARGHLTLAGVKATWAAAMLRYYPRVPPTSFSAKEFAVLKMKITPMLATCNLSEFFDYIVSSWTTLRGTKFEWLRSKGKDVAAAPSLPELMRYYKVFSQAFADSRMREASSEAGSHRTAEAVLRDQLAAERASKAFLASEQAKLKDKLARAERIAYGRETPAGAKPKSLSERQKALDEGYNDDIELPEWK